MTARTYTPDEWDDLSQFDPDDLEPHKAPDYFDRITDRGDDE